MQPYRLSSGKVIGRVDSAGILHKRAKKEHLLQKFDGFAQAQEVLDDPNVKGYAIFYEVDRKLYRASRETYQTKGIRWRTAQVESQRVLPRKFFSVTDPNHPTLFDEGGEEQVSSTEVTAPS